MTRLGYQIPNFTYPGISGGDIFDNVVAQAKAAEAAGFDRIFVMDHFYQLPGIGAGWFELEHDSLGYEFGTFTDRFEKLEESLQIIGPMLRDEPVSFDGKHYQVTDAVNSPAPVSKIPIMVGGSGEKKTLRMVAQYADESNLVRVGPDDVPRKLEALAHHCEQVGRDRSEIDVTAMQMVIVAATMEAAEADVADMAAAKGWSPEIAGMVKSMLIFGDADTVGERLQAVMDAGLDGLTLDLPANGHHTERIALLGEIGLKVTAR